jgi:Flp pilus assembly protein TadG
MRLPLRRLQRRCNEHGSSSVELVVVLPVFIIAMMLLRLAWVTTATRGDVRFAAAQGARSATMAQSTQGAKTRAEAAVQDVIRDRKIPCQVVDVDVSGVEGSVRPDSTVGVTVTCTANWSGLSLLGLGRSSMDFSATSVAVVDRFRGGE